MAEKQKQHPKLMEVARTIAADLKCTPETAMGQAILGVAATAKGAGVKVSLKPTPDEIEQILDKHWEKLQRFAESVPDKNSASPGAKAQKH